MITGGRQAKVLGLGTLKLVVFVVLQGVVFDAI